MKVAIDIGGVIGPQLADRRQSDGTWSMNPGPMPGAIEAVRQLVQKLGQENVFILSRVSDKAKVIAVKAWLDHWKFVELTGFKEWNVIVYDGDRAEKSRIVRERGITAMVDDRVEVLVEMDEGVELIAFAPDYDELNQFFSKLNGRALMILKSWEHFKKHFGLLPTVE